MKRIISEKGQLTIPKSLRTSLGLRAGQVVDVTETRGKLLITKIVHSDPIADFYGIIGSGRDVDKLVEQLRGPPPRK